MTYREIYSIWQLGLYYSTVDLLKTPDKAFLMLFLFSAKKYRYFSYFFKKIYVMGTHNIYFRGEIQKNIMWITSPCLELYDDFHKG